MTSWPTISQPLLHHSISLHLQYESWPHGLSGSRPTWHTVMGEGMPVCA
jgi:hypothetical protein